METTTVEFMAIPRPASPTPTENLSGMRISEVEVAQARANPVEEAPTKEVLP